MLLTIFLPHLAISQNISMFYLQINKELGDFISELVLYRKFLPNGVFPSPLLHTTNEKLNYQFFFFYSFIDKILNSYVENNN